MPNIIIDTFLNSLAYPSDWNVALLLHWPHKSFPVAESFEVKCIVRLSYEAWFVVPSENTGGWRGAHPIRSAEKIIYCGCHKYSHLLICCIIGRDLRWNLLPLVFFVMLPTLSNYNERRSERQLHIIWRRWWKGEIVNFHMNFFD